MDHCWSSLYQSLGKLTSSAISDQRLQASQKAFAEGLTKWNNSKNETGKQLQVKVILLVCNFS